MTINKELFREYFNFQALSFMLRHLFHTITKNENDDLVDKNKSGLSDLKEETEKAIEKPDKIVDIVVEILEFNRQRQDGQGLKILTLDQNLNRLPVTLAQSKVWNNSEKLKHEIRQLLHSLHRSKKLSKTICKHLVSII